MRYRLRTLLMVLALGPPVLAGGYFLWGRYSAWREGVLRENREWRQAMERVPEPEPPSPYREGDGVFH